MTQNQPILTRQFPPLAAIEDQPVWIVGAESPLSSEPSVLDSVRRGGLIHEKTPMRVSQNASRQRTMQPPSRKTTKRRCLKGQLRTIKTADLAVFNGRRNPTHVELPDPKHVLPSFREPVGQQQAAAGTCQNPAGLFLDRRIGMDDSCRRFLAMECAGPKSY